MAGPVLLFVGAVLFLNGLWILGKIQDSEIAIINVFTGLVGLIAAIISFARGDPESIQFGGYVLLFAFTYLWVAYNRYVHPDGQGLGWFCFFVALTAVPVGLTVLQGANGNVWPTWLGLNWLAWAVLWFMYFLLLALHWQIAKVTGWVTLFEGVVTAWVPGYLLLSGRLS
jgi:hypothetical protein